ncbi:MAG: aminotransferase class III-fold pyridoxal phosphate-dependent enzyme [Reyranella sp.]|uniref:aspartate aminotransferase family protein n=1 Tax=Reyranella sp. TaxID=1929291 RepID=UPI001AC5A07A|nr:aminotransferase class III-fold pyridoxal phosphate-dependent enzyme [Reyranella sp.]MBN9089498.1 aminotransferase class III-fold pyridoxal phosphate-dependent enzyme [Reyranella sp.]
MPDSPLVNSDLQSALAEARQAYTDRNPKSLARQHEAVEAMPGGNTRTTLHNAPFPLTVVRGEGCRLWDADGHEYIDVLGEYTAGIYGHSHPVIRAAIDKALNHGWNYAGRNPNEARLAKLIVDRIPSIDLVRFTNSGTEGNVMALAGARVFAQRKGRKKATKVMVFHGGYHGGVLYFVSGGSPVNMPYEYIVGTYNDVEGTRALLRQHAQEIFAVLLEPMQGSHGCLPGDPAFLHMLREETWSHDITLIFDEVMTSRLSPGGLQAKLGVTPDMTTLGKYIGGGMSFGAFGGRREIMELFDPTKPDHLPHAGTFNNNVLTMAAGAAGYGEVYTPEAANALNARGEKIRERLNAICRKAGVAFQFSGIGSMMTAHATTRPIKSAADIATSNQDAKELFYFDMVAAGIWIARRGFVALNIMIGDDEADRFVAAVDEFVSARKALLRPQ